MKGVKFTMLLLFHAQDGVLETYVSHLVFPRSSSLDLQDAAEGVLHLRNHEQPAVEGERSKNLASLDRCFLFRKHLD